MILRLGLYFLKQALINIMTNRVVHFIGLGTLVVSLLIFGSFLLLFVNLNTWIQGRGQSLTMSVYLEDGISGTARQGIENLIRDLPNAEIERFISKEEALRDLKKTLGAQAGLFDGLSENPLPASYEVVLTEMENPMGGPQRLKRTLENMEGVEEVQYSEEAITWFEGVMGVAKIIGFIIGSFLCLCVLFIVTNTIKLAIYSRRDEIEILKLVGATDWFVMMPFLLEGLIQGVLGGMLSLLTLFAAFLFLSSRKIHFLGLSMLDFVFLPGRYTLSILFISLGLGLVGSFIAVGRFFRR